MQKISAIYKRNIQCSFQVFKLLKDEEINAHFNLSLTYLEGDKIPDF